MILCGERIKAAKAEQIGLVEEVVVTGGVAKSKGVVRALAARLGVELVGLDKPYDPQIIGALGAAVVASEKGGP